MCVRNFQESTVDTSSKVFTGCPVRDRIIRAVPWRVKRRLLQQTAGEGLVLVPQDTNEPSLDTIATLTAHMKTLVELANRLADRLLHTKCYIVLTRTTQPAHAILFLASLAVAWNLAPSSPTQSASCTAALLHLACFAAHLGAQLWMTFVSGLSLYFSLPRHHFGAVQRVLFPRYFTLNAVLSLGMLISFTRLHPTALRDSTLSIQAISMTACFLAELAVRLYLTGPLVSLISAKEVIERKAGLGQEIGRQEMGELTHCPHYSRLHHTFRRVHMGIAITNMACLACSGVHLYFLAMKLV